MCSRGTLNAPLRSSYISRLGGFSKRLPIPAGGSDGAVMHRAVLRQRSSRPQFRLDELVLKSLAELLALLAGGVRRDGAQLTSTAHNASERERDARAVPRSGPGRARHRASERNDRAAGELRRDDRPQLRDVTRPAGAVGDEPDRLAAAGEVDELVQGVLATAGR